MKRMFLCLVLACLGVAAATAGTTRKAPPPRVQARIADAHRQATREKFLSGAQRRTLDRKYPAKGTPARRAAVNRMLLQSPPPPGGTGNCGDAGSTLVVLDSGGGSYSTVSTSPTAEGTSATIDVKFNILTGSTGSTPPGYYGTVSVTDNLGHSWALAKQVPNFTVVCNNGGIGGQMFEVKFTLPWLPYLGSGNYYIITPGLYCNTSGTWNLVSGSGTPRYFTIDSSSVTYPATMYYANILPGSFSPGPETIHAADTVVKETYSGTATSANSSYPALAYILVTDSRSGGDDYLCIGFLAHVAAAGGTGFDAAVAMECVGAASPGLTYGWDCYQWSGPSQASCSATPPASSNHLGDITVTVINP